MSEETDYDEQPGTWKQFRDLVEKQMREHNIPEDALLWYIDVNAFPGDVGIYMDETLGMAIS
jgi:hypothetical protein